MHQSSSNAPFEAGTPGKQEGDTQGRRIRASWSVYSPVRWMPSRSEQVLASSLQPYSQWSRNFPAALLSMQLLLNAGAVAQLQRCTEEVIVMPNLWYGG